MVNWYDPKQLSNTGVKTVLSGVFGNFADRRETLAALSQDVNYFDHSEKEELWLDFICDLGDGFNPTYTLAHLLAQEKLEAGGEALKRGDILVMGGDEIYPTPEMHEYDNRLKGPYTAAFPKNEEDTQRPEVYAIPGNHDWYDGLSNFLKLFTQKRSFGNWKTKQNRSYFAIKLPHDYWLIAVDIQLQADIDYPQICYFREIAEKEFTENTKVILCTAEPSWVLCSFDQKNTAHERFKFFIDRILYGKGDEKYEEKNKHIDVTTILTGDLHHYARYEEISKKNSVCQLITAGGGGAFLHPTHTLKEKIEPVDGYDATLKKVFPEKEDSIKLSFLNLIFPFYSITMLLFFGVYHLFTSWILQTKELGGTSYMERLAQVDLFNGGFQDFLSATSVAISHNPGAVFLNILLFLGLLVFTDTKSGNGKWNYIAGAVHGFLHLVNFYLLIWWFSRLNLHHFGLDLDTAKQVLIYSLEMILVGGIISGVLFGLYLTFSVLVLKNHITEAASSYRWEGYKNFLRIKLDKDALTIYPIGLKKVVSNWKNVGTEDKPKFEGSPINYELIEKPIIIKHEKTL